MMTDFCFTAAKVRKKREKVKMNSEKFATALLLLVIFDMR
jgi:hypothetical protein